MHVPLASPPDAALYDFGRLLSKGYFENPQGPYKIVGPKSDLVLLPASYANDLAAQPSNKLSFGAAIHDFWVSRHTTWRYYLDDDTGRQTLMGSLKRDGAHIIPVLDEEISLAMDNWEQRGFQSINKTLETRKQLHDGWISVEINPSFRPLVNQAFGRVLVDAPLCRDPGWLDHANGLGLKMMLAARDLRTIPDCLRPLAKQFLPTYRSLMTARRELASRIDPLVQRRLSCRNMHDDRHHDMIEYQLNHSAGWRGVDINFQTGQIFDNVFAGDSTFSRSLMQCIYDLATYPEYQKPLREEIRTMLSNGATLSLQNIGMLRKVDSFMKEVLRLSPGTLVVMARKALVEVKLSDGLTIPRGVTVAMPSYALNHDPNIYGSDATEFKPFRFLDISDAPSSSLAFESISGPGLDFGRGKASCPGRYIALWTMKVILARFIQRYEVRLQDGAQRPVNIEAGVHKIANLEGNILIRLAP
ncbi:cytochrome P450 [Colletotrichum chrysophilum]|uniref:Cytochrome P450 n=1 Tax=Colletotrichum chrysophilum TaxID=1836956 RepID=A0AAD9AL98_9PEZI|nr:cytochrome P450 [Colletotrichum chrysophilum]